MPSGGVPVPMGPDARSSRLDGSGARAEPAVRSRALGAWDAPSEDFSGDIRRLGAALAGYGLSDGARAAVLGSEGWGTLQAGLAVIVAGGTLVPLDPGISDEVLRRTLAATGVVQAIASDERQLSRLLALRPELSALELLLLISATPSERKPAAMLVATAIEVGAASLVTDDAASHGAPSVKEGATPCVLVDSSGGTREVGRAALNGLASAFVRVLGLTRQSTVISSLPVAGLERLALAMAAQSQRAPLLLANPSERPDAGLDACPVDSVVLDLVSLERLFRAWNEDIDAQGWLRRTATRWALRQGRSAPPDGWKHRAADRIALRGLRAKLGGRTTVLHVIAARRASDEVESFFSAAGLTIRYFSPESLTPLAR